MHLSVFLGPVIKVTTYSFSFSIKDDCSVKSNLTFHTSTRPKAWLPEKLVLFYNPLENVIFI